MAKKRNAVGKGLAAVALLSLAACGGGDEASSGGSSGDGATEGESIVLRVGHQNGPNEPMELGAQRAGEILDERTDGRITVETFPSAQLGSENELIEQNQSGTVEMSLPSPSALANFYPTAAIFSMPYSLEGDTEQEQYDTLVQLMETDVVTDLTDAMAAETGVRPLDWSWWYGNRHVTNSVREVSTPDDLNGLQIRTPDAPIHFLALEKFGASVTPLAFGELYLALQTGTVDGQENPVNVIVAQAFNEVQDYVSLTAHLTQAQVPIVNEEFWQSLSAEDQELIQEAFREAGEYQSELALEANAEGVDTLRDAGMSVTEPDLGPFRDATADAAEEWSEENPEFDLEVFEAFRAAQE